MEERESLNQLLEKQIFQHPLTLRLLGKAAGAKLWTLEELESELETAWVETTGDAGLRDMYRRLYRLFRNFRNRRTAGTYLCDPALS